MKHLLKNKIFIILSIFILLLSFLTSSCFAYDVIDKNENTYTIPDYFSNYKYIFFISASFGQYVYFSNTPFYFKQIDGAIYCCPLNDECSFYKISVGTTINSLFNNYSIEDIESSFRKLCISNSVFYSGTTERFLNDMVFSVNVNVLDSDDNVVFQGAPRPVEQVTIPEITQVAEIPQVITQIMKIIIPIGLIVLSIGFVIYLVRLVTSRVI